MAEAIVVDASIVVRGLTAPGAAADVLGEIDSGATVAHAPDVIVAEVSNALAVTVRTERRSLGDARAALELFAAYPIELHRGIQLAPAAVELAAATRLSAYDGFYAVLAAALAVPLVTADRRLAAAVAGSVLVE